MTELPVLELQFILQVVKLGFLAYTGLHLLIMLVVSRQVFLANTSVKTPFRSFVLLFSFVQAGFLFMILVLTLAI